MPNWRGIVVHHSETTDTAELDTKNIRRYHVKNRKWADIGYHFLVEKVGTSYEVIGGRPLNMNGAHARGSNTTHIGVCLVGNFMKRVPPAAQLKVAARHIKGLMSALDIPRSAVKLHREVGNTDCPGDRFSKDALMAML